MPGRGAKLTELGYRDWAQMPARPADRNGPTMHPGRLLLTITLLAALGAVSACGRRPGQLDTPYDAAVEARKEAEKAKKPLPPMPEKPERDKPFILDSLIQ
jgi:predicted small lipoprotein YifL